MVLAIFILCIILFILDIFKPSTVAMLGCILMVCLGGFPLAKALGGFTNDIVLIVFGTEIFGIAFFDCGLGSAAASRILSLSKGKEKRIIIIAGCIAALMSAFLNNQVVCSMMMVICSSISKAQKNIDSKNIILPVIICAILGGQCTLIGAPATLIASSIAEESTGQGISMFELLPLGLLIFAASSAMICSFSYKRGIKIWGERKDEPAEASEELTDVRINRRGAAVTLIAAAVMLVLFITEAVSVGVASVIGALICLIGRAVDEKKALRETDWNVIIWLGCSIGLAGALNESGAVQRVSEWIYRTLPADVPAIALLAVFVVMTVLISNVLANTTTVIMILPFAIDVAERYSLAPTPFVVAVTMAAGLSIMTPLSCGFIGMTMRAGYKFRDYIRYGWSLQSALILLIIGLTPSIFHF
ncbi:MAG: anion permease [Ruminococcus sp.]|nr:anion permease [Ruminococcus sp.]